MTPLHQQGRHLFRLVLGQRLFWKILLGFWLTFILIVEGLWIYIALLGDSHRPGDTYYLDASASSHVASISWAISTGGLQGATTLIQSWPERDQAMVAVATPETRSLLPETVRYRDAEAVAPDGTRYLIRHRLPDEPRRPRQIPYPWQMPPELWVMGVVGGLGFASVLAWYLIRPIQTLRSGFGRLAGGDLHARVQGVMGSRRDELADLAHSFDRMAERLEKLVAARDQLLHDVSHELRSPLARLHMAVGLARQSPQKLEATLDRIEAEGKRLDDMVGELLTLSRAEAGGKDGESYFAVYHLIEAVLADAAFEAQSSQVQITARLRELTGVDAEDGPILSGNARLIRRALENVVRNALRYSPGGGTITVTAAPDTVQGTLVITIEDDGPGVADDDLPNLFEPFVRGSNSSSDSGFGLGLAIARRAIEAHQGTISARNRAHGGLAVRIALPMGE
ncbi:HAMP domain-containing histidine kinase [Insolitispirillum peregrinum]|uniref:histidine kinase n=1 Tax=Insolitispirillum peregrinum TaxID=80876 RepID=A0A1N7NLN2_9PROT|nr:HAMP domain-containing histidine kinase [Insolitispirillum peregrinum]SIS99303.1 two-component system, OmpR family, sensor kinase [Insolitispirillum peregrinum]